MSDEKCERSVLRRKKGSGRQTVEGRGSQGNASIATETVRSNSNSSQSQAPRPYLHESKPALPPPNTRSEHPSASPKPSSYPSQLPEALRSLQHHKP
ncbi:hypothetical protein MRB53_018982 [Persea americana]|uniref:Uncharacterized protein n=1 Tax=Persea americana TaxID=3435 RepID=A0ACC2MA53_PERAE|nr:hypothetical protein MRB53_018982 [Persea americana]